MVIHKITCGCLKRGIDKGINHAGHKETFEVDGHILHFACGGVFTGTHTCQVIDLYTSSVYMYCL